ncbi:MAG TPA: hypothetical protein VMI75_02810 [Polyangiaceae bacterium]|nr:hypothetical protein [Polyangiaceae bacterium]
MRTSRWILSLGLIGLVACTTNIPTDTSGDPTSREIPASGVIRGAVLYTGPHPCSENGHIVGSAVVLVFDRRNPPPPNGLATTAVNFVAVTGDLLFPNEPRWTGSNRYCPLDHGIVDDVTVTAPFAISPLVAGSYVLESFFDYTGNFLPTFKFRNLPEKGDVGGGVIDAADALLPVNQNPNYLPHFLPVDIGTPQPLPKGALPGLVPNFAMPASGYVADNVNVTVGKVFTSTRPYFYAQGLSMGTMGSGLSAAVVGTVVQSSDQQATNTTGITGSVDAKDCTSDPKKIVNSNCANYAPVLTIPQDIQALAPPTASDLSPADANAFENSYPHLRLLFGTAPSEASDAQASPYNMQLTPFNPNGGGGGILVWQNEYFDSTTQLWKPQQIPEGNNVPNLWPLVVLSKLVDDGGPANKHANDPARLTAQGDATHPVVIMEGITLLGGAMASNPAVGATESDSLLNTVEASGYPFPPNTLTDATGQPHQFLQDHLTVMLRPAVFCFDTLFDPNNPDKRGNIVTPYLTGASATPGKTGNIVPLGLLQNDGKMLASVANLIKPPPNYTAGVTSPAIQGCLPTGKYSINVVYPDGQAWTVPNEIGACTGQASGEGDTQWNNSPITCTLQGIRHVLRSQGPRAVVEIVAATNPAHCKGASQSSTNPGVVPSICGGQ